MKITFEQIKNDKTIQAYIRKADQYLSAIGFTEHSFAHVGMCATKASAILKDLGYSEREQELAKKRGQYAAFKDEFLTNPVSRCTFRSYLWYLDCSFCCTYIYLVYGHQCLAKSSPENRGSES